jgi:hypothetical protein
MPFLTDQQVRAALAENGMVPHADSKLMMDHYSKMADSFIRAYLGEAKPSPVFAVDPPKFIEHSSANLPPPTAKKAAPPIIGDLFA